MSIAPELAAAYLRTIYWVNARPEPIALRVGDRSSRLDRILTAAGCREWAFVTAWNPRSEWQSRWRNTARQSRLVRALRRNGYRWLAGLGEGDDGDWPAEPSVLVPGMSMQEAVRWGRHFGQHAVLAGKLGQPATLLWCNGKNT